MVMFRPTKYMLEAKARFWRNVRENPMVSDVDGLPMTEVARMAGSKSIPKWAEEHEGFKQWFADPNSIQDKIAVGAEKAVDRLIEILNTEAGTGRDAVVTTSHQLTAAKELLAYSGHRPAEKTEHKVSAEQLPDDEAALRKYIESNAKKLKVLNNE
jgi:hypothetical protein